MEWIAILVFAALIGWAASVEKARSEREAKERFTRQIEAEIWEKIVAELERARALVERMEDLESRPLVVDRPDEARTGGRWHCDNNGKRVFREPRVLTESDQGPSLSDPAYRRAK